MSAGSYLGYMLQTITERGCRILSFKTREAGAVASIEAIEAQCEALLSNRGEASGMALAREILKQWEQLAEDQKRCFMLTLLDRFGPDPDRLDEAIDCYRADPSPQALLALSRAVEPRRQGLIRHLNLAPGGIATLVRMREALLKLKSRHPDLEALDADFAHLFASWFNPGFLVLRAITWSTPADILEKIIRYEAVHDIRDWDELKRRLQPEDRRCFAFFHPLLSDDPLIFVEVALMKAIPAEIAVVLDEDRAPIRAGEATTAVFYSISTCQKGLRGISFGNFLIKQVVEDLRRELPRLDTFVTLSPVPGFADWLANERSAEASEALDAEDKLVLAELDSLQWPQDEEKADALQPVLMAAASWYFLRARDRLGRVVDSVARFHLGNGARLERINFLADRSSRAMREAHGLMVNYLYKLDDIEANHAAFAGRDEVVATQPICKLLRLDRRARKYAWATNTNGEATDSARKTEIFS